MVFQKRNGLEIVLFFVYNNDNNDNNNICFLFVLERKRN